jgi:hypothetical protein
MVVRSQLVESARSRYLEAWSEWSGQLFLIGVRTELLENREHPGEFVEITRFEDGTEATLADDRMARISAELAACCGRREGMLDLLHSVA